MFDILSSLENDFCFERFSCGARLYLLDGRIVMCKNGHTQRTMTARILSRLERVNKHSTVSMVQGESSPEEVELDKLHSLPKSKRKGLTEQQKLNISNGMRLMIQEKYRGVFLKCKHCSKQVPRTSGRQFLCVDCSKLENTRRATQAGIAIRAKEKARKEALALLLEKAVNNVA